jgi:hypothetical protein
VRFPSCHNPPDSAAVDSVLSDIPEIQRSANVCARFEVGAGLSIDDVHHMAVSFHRTTQLTDRIETTWRWSHVLRIPARATDTVIGGAIVTVALADLVSSCCLTAVPVIVCTAPTGTGAVYNPAALNAPTAGLIVHGTALNVDLVTSAVNSCVCPGHSVLLSG